PDLRPPTSDFRLPKMPSDPILPSRYAIGKVRISATNLEEAADILLAQAQRGEPGYVCAPNVRATYIANRETDYTDILNRSLLTVPDGKPLVWYAHLCGLGHVRRTCGPDLFNRICAATEKTEHSHYFFGSTPEVIQKLETEVRAKFPRLKVVGMQSPPFAPVEVLAESGIVEEINRLRPTFVWVGLGAPKQERFIARIIDRIDASLLLAVGLVFEYEAGTVKRAPRWMQRCGLEGVARVCQQPERTGRAAKVFSWMIGMLALRAVRRIFRGRDSFEK
ncbi:MAG: WecB/TagA/CpsF family glycosyltransferase, partial [Opitutales bacterium]|nr:WecB/TagA/CpsF family glycosyltransferase [Opitutales bacterium]